MEIGSFIVSRIVILPGDNVMVMLRSALQRAFGRYVDQIDLRFILTAVLDNIFYGRPNVATRNAKDYLSCPDGIHCLVPPMQAEEVIAMIHDKIVHLLYQANLDISAPDCFDYTVDFSGDIMITAQEQKQPPIDVERLFKEHIEMEMEQGDYIPERLRRMAGVT